MIRQVKENGGAHLPSNLSYWTFVCESSSKIGRYHFKDHNMASMAIVENYAVEDCKLNSKEQTSIGHEGEFMNN